MTDEDMRIEANWRIKRIERYDGTIQANMATSRSNLVSVKRGRAKDEKVLNSTTCQNR